MNILIIFFILILIIIIFCKDKYEYYENNLYSNIYPNIYYINLINRKDRNKNIKKQLKKINCPNNLIHRINAIKKDDGALGCGLSHIKALNTALNNYKKDNSIKYVLILEDDFEWKYNKKFTINKLINILNSKIDWNIILLSCNGKTIDINNENLKKVINCQTTSSYLIKISYIPVLLKLWKENMKKRKYKIDISGKTTIDISWKKLQNDKWYISNPILGKQMKSYSDIEKRNVNYNV